MNREERDAEMKAIIGDAEPVDTSVSIIGNTGTAVVGNNNAIIIHDTRRPGERIGEDQQQEIREHIESLVKVDCLIGAARNPKDTRTLEQRQNSARRKRWHALRSEFRVGSFTRLTQSQLNDALAWLNAQKHAALDQLGPPAKDRPQRKPSLKRPVRLMALLLVALAVPLMFSVSPTQRPPSTISGLIPAITMDKLPVIHPADALIPIGQLTVEPLQPYFEFHTGCTLFRAPQRSLPGDHMVTGSQHDI